MSETPHPRGDRSPRRPPLWRRLFEGWQAIAGRFGFAQTQVLLTLIYLLVIGPTSLVLRLGRADPLEKRPLPEGGSGWHDLEPETQDVERLRHPF